MGVEADTKVCKEMMTTEVRMLAILGQCAVADTESQGSHDA